MQLLAREQLCVCHLVEELEAAQPLVSHHLGVLRRAGLIDSERFRYWTYYRLIPGALDALAQRLASPANDLPPAQPPRRPCC